MIKTRQEEFKDRAKKMSVNTLIDAIKKEEVNYGDILAIKLSDENVLNKWLFDYKKVSTFNTQYRRNSEGRMESYIVESGKVRPTSDGKAQLIYLIQMTKKYNSYHLASIVNKVVKMLINDAVNEGHYYKASEDGSAVKDVVSLDFSEILKNYLQLPEDMMRGDTLLKFLQHDNISSMLDKKDGYTALKQIMTGGYDLYVDDLSKIIGYIDSRLVRMEEQMISLEDKTLDKKIRKNLQDFVNGFQIGEWDAIDFTQKLKKCNSEVRHFYKAKYNKELNRYFNMFKPYRDKYEIDGKQKYRELSELYSDLEKTYEIVNDEQFVNASRTNDKYIEIFNKYISICRKYTGAQHVQQMNMLRKEVSEIFGIIPTSSETPKTKKSTQVDVM